MDDFTAKFGVANKFGLIQGNANAISSRVDARYGKV
jgi:hypothetical protein